MFYRFLTILLVVFIPAIFFPSQASAVNVRSSSNTPIEEVFLQLEKPGGGSDGWDFFHLEGETVSFYEQRDYLPAWLAGDKLSSSANILLEYLRASYEEGFCPQDYHLRQIENLIALNRFATKEWSITNRRWLARLDVLLTDAFMLYASDFIHGRVHPQDVGNRWRFDKNGPDTARLLQFAVVNQQVPQVLEQIKPSYPGYQPLLYGLMKYRELTAAGGWVRLPAGPSLRLGDRGPRVLLLRERLAISGELKVLEEPASDLFDANLHTALAHFQRRHGLVEDGVLGANTLKELNVSVQQRIRQIEVNLERLRWLPKSLGERHLIVNIPDFRLSVIENEKEIMEMPVIVGREYRKTPVFSAKMSYLEFSPYWYVPPTILKEDKLPRIRNNPGWLAEHHYELIPWKGGKGASLDPLLIDWKAVRPEKFPGMLRQRPGPWNPLGRVKFMFPNRHAIYLHDTNERYLFSYKRRLFSSGCIRIERPVELAEYLLQDLGWHRESILGAMNRREPMRVDLPEALPVYIFYMTAWADAEGIIHFREDIYLKDRILEQGLLNRFQKPLFHHRE